MMSKNPLDTPRDRKFTREELMEALRLSIIAELDAINMYSQFARACEGRFREVFEDVAKEEKTHVGEFLALLKALDSEQAAELKAGEREVRELTGLEESESK
ncbi:MAG: rubrerythrin [Thermoprotei archaeon]|nr:MAG: rubrerythrin [Thermoprotei archaeon]